MKNSRQFYLNIPSFSKFSDILKSENYVDVPDDWWIVITDVVGSTVAIEDGRYKDVNTIGAATLAAIQNVLNGEAIPFVFGGDGASAVIPSQVKEPVMQELCGLRKIALEQFGLELRVGIISVLEIKNNGCDVRIAKYISNNNIMAFFLGGGLTLADTLIKDDYERYEIPRYEQSYTNLKYLSCRWRPIPATHGLILAILFNDPQERTEVYSQFLSDTNAILGKNVASANPVHVQKLYLRSFIEQIKDDLKSQYGYFRVLYRMLETLVVNAIFRTPLKKVLPKYQNYLEDNASHSDFFKLDDMLRMVIDCTPEQAKAIEKLCLEMRNLKGICYGIHQSTEAVMTCYVRGVNKGNHIHFIDCGGGGYAMAAKQLKQQFKSSR